MFHRISAEPVTVWSRVNSNDTDTPSESSAGKNPSVGPVPDGKFPLLVPLGSVLAPSTPPWPLMFSSPVKMTYPVKIPVSTPVSVN